MRYVRIETVTFTDINGNQFPVKEMREYPDYELLITKKGENDLKIYELASRQEIYGDNGEFLSYAIVDINIEKMLENNFNINKLENIKVPVIQEV